MGKNLRLVKNVALKTECIKKDYTNTRDQDFGLSRSAKENSESMYYRSTGGAFPLRWTAPEALTTPVNLNF